MRELARRGDVEVTVDSAGTGGWHVGELADPRSRAAAAKRGYQLTHRARQFVGEDLQRFDLVVVMDRANLAAVRRLAELHAGGPIARVALLRSYEPDGAGADVPDPYSGDEGGFERVLDICERACAGLVEHVRRG